MNYDFEMKEYLFTQTINFKVIWHANLFFLRSKWIVISIWKYLFIVLMAKWYWLGLSPSIAFLVDTSNEITIILAELVDEITIQLNNNNIGEFGRWNSNAI